MLYEDMQFMLMEYYKISNTFSVKPTETNAAHNRGGGVVSDI